MSKSTLTAALVLLVACSGDSPAPEGAAANHADADTGHASDAVDAAAADIQVQESDVQVKVDAEPAAADVATDAAPADVGPACQPGERRCTAAAVEICQSGAWVVEQLCQGDLICDAGQCVKGADCEAGAIDGCAAVDALNQCNEAGTAWIKVACPTGEKCLDGACSNLVCIPDTSVCASPTSTKTCADDGSAYSEPVACKPGASCIGGKCLSACEADVKYGTNVGCAFWSLDLGQWEVKPGQINLDGSVAPIPHAVVVANPGLSTATVSFFKSGGVPIELPDTTVAGGSVRAFEMPVMSLQDSEVSDLSIRLTTDRPVIALQFNPLDNVFAYSNDASLLLPEPAFGTEHIAVTLPSVMPPAMIKSPTVWGYLTVVATLPGETKVTVVPTAPTEAGPELPSFPAGEPVEVTLQQWQVLNLNALATVSGTNDLTGSIITSDRPVAAFSGHQCMSVGETCDHLETQLLPLESWGNSFVAVSSVGTIDIFRVVSGVDDNTITAIPFVPGLSGAKLNKGEWVEVKSVPEFQVSGTGPIEVVQYMAVEDPSMSLLVATDRFLDDYPILVPSNFANNWLTIIRKPGKSVQIDGIPVNGSVAKVGIGMWERVQLTVGEGVHRLTGEEPFGVMLYGFDSAVSYFVPGGMATAVE